MIIKSIMTDEDRKALEYMLFVRICYAISIT